MDPHTLIEMEIDAWRQAHDEHSTDGRALLDRVADHHDIDPDGEGVVRAVSEVLEHRYGTRRIREWWRGDDIPEWVAAEIEGYLETGELGHVRSPIQCSPLYLGDKIRQIKQQYGDCDTPPITR